MTSLLALNENGDKVWLKIIDLEKDQPYLVTDCKQTPSKFDINTTQTVLELKCGFVTLPSRFNNMGLELVNLLKSKNICIIKGAQVGKTFRAKFEEKSNCVNYK